MHKLGHYPTSKNPESSGKGKTSHRTEGSTKKKKLFSAPKILTRKNQQNQILQKQPNPLLSIQDWIDYHHWIQPELT
jgi:hypothetical protein